MVDVALEVFFVSEDSTKKIMVSLPQHLINELDGMLEQQKVNRSEIIHKATKMYLKEHKKQQIRETMQQGYMEMSKINLNIATEAFLAEEEAELTLDRLVSGV
ncbi:CopG family ribbon-helix-helix protein [Evansella tamaricis]|uniref:Antitoxin n=1 Tax=Evansella tamaricis TaxID=2069301 RepID=A0ABS6J9R7_9BACI|nr:antitoxin [Evansella tamaricis]MBU9710432.1 antitoxin [Evansella tamaricis]